MPSNPAHPHRGRQQQTSEEVGGKMSGGGAGTVGTVLNQGLVEHL